MKRAMLSLRKTHEISSFKNIFAFFIEQSENHSGPLCKRQKSRFSQGGAGRCNHVSLHRSGSSIPTGIPLQGEQVVELLCPPWGFRGRVILSCCQGSKEGLPVKLDRANRYSQSSWEKWGQRVRSPAICLSCSLVSIHYLISQLLNEELFYLFSSSVERLGWKKAIDYCCY